MDFIYFFLFTAGILLAESESKNTRYESGHSLASVDSIAHAGHSFRPRPPSSKVPQKSLPPVTGDTFVPPPNSTVSGTGDTVSPPHPTVSSKVPVISNSSHSQTIGKWSYKFGFNFLVFAKSCHLHVCSLLTYLYEVKEGCD